MEIRAARSDEADTLTGLAQRAKRHWGYPAEWMAEWQSALTLTPAYLAHHRVVVAAADDRPRPGDPARALPILTYSSPAE